MSTALQLLSEFEANTDAMGSTGEPIGKLGTEMAFHRFGSR
jgi:hypothetical protein